MVRVSAARKPERCVPPSTVLMLLAKLKTDLGVAVVVLQGDVDLDAVAQGLHDDGLVVQDGLAAVEMLDELGDAAGVAELGAAGFAGLGVGGALVGERDFQALVEEGHLAQPLGERVVVELGGGEDGLVGQEVDLGAATLAGAGFLELRCGSALGVALLVGVRRLAGFFRTPDFDFELLTERVDATDADAVQAAGDFVVGGVELAAGVQLGEDDLRGRHALAVGQIHHVDGNAAAIVDDGDGVVDVDDDIDFLGVAGESFVDGVVDDLVDEVMQTDLARRADVHGGTEADGLKAFKDLDVFAGVAVVIAVNGGGAERFSRHRIPFAKCSVMLEGRRGSIRTRKPDAEAGVTA